MTGKKTIAVLALLAGIAVSALSACSQVVRADQVQQYKSITDLTKQLFARNILSPKDRLLVLQLPSPPATTRQSGPSPDEQAFFEDAFVAGLVKDGAMVLQNMIVNPPAAQTPIDRAIGELAARGSKADSAGSTPLARLLETSAQLHQDELYVRVGDHRLAFRKVGDSLTDFGITKVLLYRWVFHSDPDPGDSDGSDAGRAGNRVFVRVVDAATGYIVWSDLLVVQGG